MPGQPLTIHLTYGKYDIKLASQIVQKVSFKDNQGSVLNLTIKISGTCLLYEECLVKSKKVKFAQLKMMVKAHQLKPLPNLYKHHNERVLFSADGESSQGLVRHGANVLR